MPLGYPPWPLGLVLGVTACTGMQDMLEKPVRLVLCLKWSDAHIEPGVGATTLTSLQFQMAETPRRCLSMLCRWQSLKHRSTCSAPEPRPIGLQ